jgi:hypothetical protein
MKTISKILFSFLLIQISIVAFSSDDTGKDTLNLPKKALIISQATFISGIYYTMIDLENNEMVIVCYGSDTGYSVTKYFRLRKVIRTGIMLDPDKQKILSDRNLFDEKRQDQ